MQERLRTLRSSLGSAAKPQNEISSSQRREASSRHMRAESPSPDKQKGKAGDPTALEGLCSLLELHLGTLEQAQEPLHGWEASLGKP